VRSAGDPLLIAEVALDDPEVTARREASIAVRLGLASTSDGAL
jgi:hypothetical protein